MPEPDVRQLIAELLERAEAGEEVDLESLALAHPEAAEDLRRLWNDHLAEGKARRERADRIYQQAIDEGLTPALDDLIREHPDIAAELLEVETDRKEMLRHIAQAMPNATWTGSFYGRRTRKPPTPGIGLYPGKVLDDFRLERVIGEGGMGRVWEASQVSLGRRVALKIVRPDIVSSRLIALFAREARAGGRLDHPGIVSVHGYGNTDGLDWISMQYIEGSWTLKDFISGLSASQELPPDYYLDVNRLVMKLAEALNAAHEAGVIHRDLKPQNILVTKDSEPMVSDFGLARITDESGFSKTGNAVGTYGYMSPEQVGAKHTPIDHRTDIFSLGVVMYELLALTRPFTGDTPQQIGHQIMHVDPPALQSLRSKVPGDLAVICSKCLEKDRRRRYGSMAELAADLKRHLESEPIHARSPGRTRKLQLWAKRNPAVSSAALVGVVALVLVSVFAVKNHHLASAYADQVNVANRQAYNASIHAASAALKAKKFKEGKQRLGSCADELRGWVWGHLYLAVDQSAQTLLGHTTKVDYVAWSPDASRFVSGASDGSLIVWDAVTGKSVWTLEGQEGHVTAVAWSPDSTRIASSALNNAIQITDASTGDPIRMLEGHTGEVYSVTWSPDGSLMASTSADSSVCIWSVETGDIAKTFAGMETNPGNRIAFDPEGSRIAVGLNTGNVEVRDVATGEILLDLTDGHIGAVNSIAWSHDATRIASGGLDGSLRIWDTATGRSDRNDGHEKSVTSVAWSPDDTILASASEDTSILLRDADSSRVIQEFRGHSLGVSSIAFSPSGSKIVSASKDKTLRVWHVGARNMLTLEGHQGPVLAVAFSPDCTSFASGDHESALRIWNAETGECARTIDTIGSSVASVAWSPDSSRIVAGLYNWEAQVRDATTGEYLLKLEGHKRPVRCVGYSPDGTLIATAGDEKVLVWDAATGEPVQTLKGHTKNVRSVAWGPDGEHIVSGSDDGGLRVWEIATGDTKLVLEEHQGPVRSVAFSPDGTSIASSSEDETIRIWSAVTGLCTKELIGHRSHVYSIAWSPDGNRIVSGSADASLLVWDVETAESLLELEGQEGWVNSVSWSSDGARIISGSRDKTVRIWESRLEDVLSIVRGD